MERVEGKEVAKRILQGLVAAARTVAFWTSGTEVLGGLLVSPGQGMDVGSGSGVGGREEPPGGASVAALIGTFHGQRELCCPRRLTCCDDRTVSVSFLASSCTIKGPLLSPWSCGLRVRR